MKPWKTRTLRFLRAILPTPGFWLIENVLQMRSGYLHEPDMRLFRALADLEMTCIDAGAHRGESAIAILSQVPAARVVSFEPNRQARLALGWLRRHYGHRFSFELAALGEQAGEAQLHIPASGRFRHTPSASLDRREFDKEHVRERFRRDGGGDITGLYSRRVPVQCIDDLGLIVDVIKIDVEGSEAAVLRGARQTLKRHAPLLLFELNNFSESGPLLNELGYRLYRFEPDPARLKPFTEGEPHPLNLIAVCDRTRPDIRQRLC